MSKGVSVVSRHSLRKGQASLYDLIVEKIKTGDKVSIDEAREIWLTKVARHVEEGIPYRTDYYANMFERDGKTYFTSSLVPMTEDEIQFTVLNWLMKNIGVLVIRGYLKVVPMVELQ